MEKYSFGYPQQCTKCSSLPRISPPPRVEPYFRDCGSNVRLMLIGQDPTILRAPERVWCVLMLDQQNGALSRWLTSLFGTGNLPSLTLYATNLIKCSFSELPSSIRPGNLGFLKQFLQPYFLNCQDYLAIEIATFWPTLALTFGEPAHQMFVSILDNRNSVADSMQAAFTGDFVKARFRGVEFDYSPCLHIKTFRVAEAYGDSVRKFKQRVLTYLKEAA